MVLSIILEFSSCLPVSVYGTGTLSLNSSFSRQRGISDFGTKFPSHSRLGLTVRGFACALAYLLRHT